MSDQPLPGTLTLAEARTRMLNTSVLDDVMGRVKLGRVMRIRFVSKPDDTDLPESMLLATFRELTAQGRAALVIDDEGDGGFTVRPREPALT